MEYEILNSKGEPVKLTPRELARAQYLEKEIHNAQGLEVSVTTMTAIQKSILEQKFFTLNLADYVPLEVGNGAWSTALTTYRSFNLAGDFESGLINTGTADTRLARADAAFDSVTIPVKNWATSIDWNIMELAQAQRANGLVDLISSKERARKQMWDLGIQKIVFFGSVSDSNIKGLLTQADVNSNTALITKKINSMTDAEFQALAAGIVAAYRINCNYTAFPNRFMIPEDDYNGLATPVNTNFAITSKLEYLEKVFKTITQDQSFRILPLAYGSASNNSAVTGLNKNRYILMNFNRDSVRMDIPVQYTNTQQNSLNGFNYQNVGYGQFTGVKAYRAQEMLYLDY